MIVGLVGDIKIAFGIQRDGRRTLQFVGNQVPRNRGDKAVRWTSRTRSCQVPQSRNCRGIYGDAGRSVERGAGSRASISVKIE